MSEIQRFQVEADGEIYDLYIEAKDHLDLSQPEEYGRRGMGVGEEAIAKLQDARRMIRGYTAYALSAFKDFGMAEIEEVNLTFGLKIGGKAGIPYITQGSAESNIEISVKCKFPPSN